MTSVIESPHVARSAAELWSDARRTSEPPERSEAIRLVHLDRDSVLRLHDAAGTRIRVIAGEARITEAQSFRTRLLAAGRAYTLAAAGTARVRARCVSCIVLETPFGISPPASVEVELAEEELNRKLADARRRRGLRCWLRALTAWWSRERDDAPPLTRDVLRDRAERHTPEAVRDRLLRSHPYPYY